MSNTKCATVAVTITTSGEMLSPLVIFKGVPKGKIEREEFVAHPVDMRHAVPDAGKCMDR